MNRLIKTLDDFRTWSKVISKSFALLSRHPTFTTAHSNVIHFIYFIQMKIVTEASYCKWMNSLNADNLIGFHCDLLLHQWHMHGRYEAEQGLPVHLPALTASSTWQPGTAVRWTLKNRDWRPELSSQWNSALRCPTSPPCAVQSRPVGLIPLLQISSLARQCFTAYSLHKVSSRDTVCRPTFHQVQTNHPPPFNTNLTLISFYSTTFVSTPARFHHSPTHWGDLQQPLMYQPARP